MNRRQFFARFGVLATPQAIAAIDEIRVRDRRALEAAGPAICPDCRSWLFPFALVAVTDAPADEPIPAECGCGWTGEVVVLRRSR